MAKKTLPRILNTEAAPEPPTLMPWDELSLAQENLETAERFGTEADISAARAEVRRHREICGLLGGFLITLALEHATKHLRAAFTSVFGADMASIYDQARIARSAANDAQQRIQLLTDRVQMLERHLRELETRCELGPK